MNVENGIQIGDLLPIARRRIWTVVAIAISVSLLGYWITMALPNQYQSSATVLIEPQAVAPELVAAGVPVSDLNQRLSIMTSQILSRPRLSRLIDKFDLYPKQADSMTRQEIIDLMRNSVSVEPVVPELESRQQNRNSETEINTFRIVFTDRNPYVAKAVAEHLANDFIEEHIDARVETSQKSLDFIQGELDRLSEEIQEVEASVAAVKHENAGRLPDDIPANQRRLERLMTDLAFAQRSYSEARSDEAFFKTQAAAAAAMSDASDETSPQRRLQLLEIELGEYQSRGFTEKHPDIVRTRAEIAVLEEKIAAEKSSDEEKGLTSFAQQNAESEAHRAAQRRTASEEEIQRLENVAAEIQALLAETPAVAEKLDALNRRYQHLFSSYQDFSNRRLEATVQAQLERRQLGEQFRVLEAPFVATAPVSPNRPLLLVLSVVFGVGLGGVAGILLETTDPSVHSARQLQQTVRIPVLASIPQILLESDRRALRRRRIRTGLATAVLVVFALVGGAASYIWVNGGHESSVVVDETTSEPGNATIGGAEG